MLSPAVVLIDARNVLRSRWPNVPERELVELVARWASEEGVEAVAVFDGRAPEVAPGRSVTVVGTGAESADDWLIREAAQLREAGKPFWLVTSDRALRAAAAEGAERVIGGGGFLATLSP
jgi:predicted RNA-binding protein with PIN domain